MAKKSMMERELKRTKLAENEVVAAKTMLDKTHQGV